MRVSRANGLYSLLKEGCLSSALATSRKYKVVDFLVSGTKSGRVLRGKVCLLLPCNAVAPATHFGALSSLTLDCVTDGGTFNPPPTRPNFISTRERLLIPR